MCGTKILNRRVLLPVPAAAIVATTEIFWAFLGIQPLDPVNHNSFGCCRLVVYCVSVIRPSLSQLFVSTMVYPIIKISIIVLNSLMLKSFSDKGIK
jgi:hypothetical protein